MQDDPSGFPFRVRNRKLVLRPLANPLSIAAGDRTLVKYALFHKRSNLAPVTGGSEAGHATFGFRVSCLFSAGFFVQATAKLASVGYGND